MAKWKTAGIVVVMVGLVALGAFAAQRSTATMTMTRTQAQASAAECSEDCEPERTRTMKEEGVQELRLLNRNLQQNRLEGNGLGNGEGRKRHGLEG